MIITTAKRPRLAPLAAALCGILAAPASHADWKVRPLAEVSETWSDNAGLRRDDPQSQWITEISPGLEVEHRSRRLTVRSTARLSYFLYSNDRAGGTNRFYRQFDGSAKAELVDDFLYVDATASLAPRNVSAFGPQAGASRYASANQSDVTTYSIAPSIVHRFGTTANLVMRYGRDRVDAGDSGFGSSDGENFMFNLASGPSYHTFGWNVRAQRNDTERFRSNRLDPMFASQRTLTENALADVIYALGRTVSLTASGGYDMYDFGSFGGRQEGPSWSTGFVWKPSSRTSVKATFGKRFIGSANSLDAQHRSRRTIWRLAYNESVNSMRSNFILPATFDTATLLDNMLLADIPDPVLRQQAVENYMRQSGLPSTLVENVSFLSNNYFLQKRLTATAGLKLPRTTATLSLYRTRNDALANVDADSVVVGPVTSSLQRNTRQVGGNLMVTYRISPRSDLRFNHTRYQTTALSNEDAKAKTQVTRLSLSRLMSRQVTGNLEVRRIAGSSLFSNYAPYRENAISASLILQR